MGWTIERFENISSKIAAKIEELKNAGRDTSQLEPWLADFNQTKGMLKKKERKTRNKGFECCHCGRWVEFSEFMGTRHRNHCPFCLWSKHLDLKEAGDRKSRCCGAMEPIGLTFKKRGKDKYGRFRQGEIMIIHQCLGCGKISINRMAADDSEGVILSLFEKSVKMPREKREYLKRQGIEVVGLKDKEEILTQLFGRQR